MSVNLVDLIMNQVGGNLPGILGSLLGESADRTQGALAGAVPALLGSLMGAANKGGAAADALNAAIDQQDDSMLDDLAGMLGGGQYKQIAEQGSGVLSSLLGDGVIGALVGAIGKFSGLGGGSTKSLLGTLAPIVLSVLSRQKREQGLDAGGMVDFLAQQRGHIESAMPKGLASALGSGGLLDSLMGTADSATETISEAVDSAAGKAGKVAGEAAAAVGSAAEGAVGAVERAAGAVTDAVDLGTDKTGDTAQKVSSSSSKTAADATAAAAGAAQSGGSWMRWLLPLIILLVLLWLGFQFLGGGDVDQMVSDAGDAAGSAVEATTEAASDAADAVSDAADDAAAATSDAADAAAETASAAADEVTAMVGDIDVGGELGGLFDNVTATLSGITDKASAEAALPELQSVNDGLDKISDLAGQLPDAAKGTVSTLVDQGVEGIDAAMAALNDISAEIGEVLQPVIDEIKEKLAAFTDA